jgi:hypothetical protein
LSVAQLEERARQFERTREAIERDTKGYVIKAPLEIVDDNEKEDECCQASTSLGRITLCA